MKFPERSFFHPRFTKLLNALFENFGSAGVSHHSLDGSQENKRRSTDVFPMLARSCQDAYSSSVEALGVQQYATAVNNLLSWQGLAASCGVNVERRQALTGYYIGFRVASLLSTNGGRGRQFSKYVKIQPVFFFPQLLNSQQHVCHNMNQSSSVGRAQDF